MLAHASDEVVSIVIELYLQQGLELCMRHRLKITDELAEKLTPPKTAASEDQQAARAQWLVTLAKLCFDQGSYHLACKKYTQVRQRCND